MRNTMNPSPFEWTRTLAAQFLDILPQYPCLWKFKSADYKDRYKRQAAAEEIKLILGVNVSLNDLIKKIQTLRKQFRKEKNLVEDSKKSGAGRDDVYAPKLWCYDALKFIIDDEPRISQTTLDSPTQVSNHI